jgi:uncharacterized protein YecE (DUF72 family)
VLHVGTSGWQYRDWRGFLYPDDLPVRRWLEHYVGAFATVEVNSTFYRLPPTETFASWARTLPAGFVMALKASRYLTHIKRLGDPAEPVARFLERAAPLGAYLGPVLVQLPPNFKVDAPRLADALDRFPRTCRLAVELRHPSWFDDTVPELLAERNVALCLTDRGSRVLGPLWRTADWGSSAFTRAGRVLVPATATPLWATEWSDWPSAGPGTRTSSSTSTKTPEVARRARRRALRPLGSTRRTATQPGP